jgi:hypothetical protein
MRTVIVLAATLSWIGISDASAAILCKSVVYDSFLGAPVLRDPDDQSPPVIPWIYMSTGQVVRTHQRYKNKFGIWMTRVTDITQMNPLGSPSWDGWVLDEYLSRNFVRCPRA